MSELIKVGFSITSERWIAICNSEKEHSVVVADLLSSLSENLTARKLVPTDEPVFFFNRFEDDPGVVVGLRVNAKSFDRISWLDRAPEISLAFVMDA